MNMRLFSDIHLEFGKFTITPLKDDSDTICVFAGDIGVGEEHKNFILDACDQFKALVYVLGNNEFYRHEYHAIKKTWNDIAATRKNLYFLDDSSVIIGDIRFIGGTMWTDMFRSNQTMMEIARRNVNDFSTIQYKEDGQLVRKLTPEDTVKIHTATASYFEQELCRKFDGKTVMVTHHLPCSVCVPDEFKTSLLNAAFHANMDNMIVRHDIDYWLYGHTHYSSKKMVAGTVLVNNARGYQGYENSTLMGFKPEMVISL